MQIIWHGLSCVRLQTKDVTILVDPLPSTVGLQSPRLQADIFAFTTVENPQFAKAEKSEGFLISTPGEYEMHGVLVQGIPVEQTDGKQLTMYTFEAEGMVIGHLGALNSKINGPQVEHLTDIDVLFVPVGGKPVLTAKEATEVLSILEPRVVIPYYYKVPGLSLHLESVEPFLKELGAKNIEPQEKIRLSRKELPEQDMQVMLLKV